MNIQDIIGQPLPDFVRERVLAQLDSLFALVVLGLLTYIGNKVRRARFLVNYSLRTRLMVGIGLIGILCAGGGLLNVRATVLILFAFTTFALLVFFVLSDLSKIGITNAFATTRQGVSAEDTLRLIERDLVFLGIGAKKLTQTDEFDNMLRRCAAADGSLKFLLSNPENAALEQMARTNGRDDLSYRSRVKESIREIFKRAPESGVKFEVRLYNLDQEIALPHFRLVFIDNRLCVFSQLFWTTAEGLDNPQLVIRRNEGSAGTSLYKGYRDYFDTLWNLQTTIVVTPELIASWPA